MKEMLKGLTVLDFTNNIAGPCTGSLLADYGANVIHIEKPVWGDDCRNFAPVFDGVSSVHMSINRTKKSVVMNLKDPAAIELVKKMAADADVLIESYRPGVMARMGLGYDQMREINPRLIYCSISAFGQTGPAAEKAGYDVIAQAFSGFMLYTGEPDGKPTKIASAIGDFSTAINAYGAIMTALYYREISGYGQHVDVCLARTLTWMNASFDHIYTGEPRRRTGNHDSSLCPYGIFERSEGEYIVIGAVNVSLWQKLCVVMGREDLINDPRFITNDARVRNSREVIAAIEDWLKSLPSVYDAAALLDKAGIPNCKLYDMDDLLNDPQVAACGWLQDVPVCKGVTAMESRKVPVGLANFSEGAIHVERAPALGEHSVEVLKRYCTDEAEALALSERWNSYGAQ